MNRFEASEVEGKGEWIVLNHVEWNVSTQSRDGLHGYSAHGKNFLENENKEASGKLGMCETWVPFLLMILAQYTLPPLLLE
jgi:hypothetical protein